MICAIYDKIVIPENLMSKNWETALAWLKGENWKDLPLGRTEIDGSRVFVLRSSYTTKRLSECRYESHRFYADIQLAWKGTELIRVCGREGLTVTVPYSEQKDVDFLEGNPELVHQAVLAFPQAAVLFPADLHMPSLALNDKPGEVEKVVVKIAL